MKTTGQERSEINLVLGGEAGLGLQTIAQILARMFMNGGLHVLAVNEFMSLIRGGSNSIMLRAAHHPVRAVNERVDLCLFLDKDSLPRLRGRCGAETLLIGDPKVLGAEAGMLSLPLTELRNKTGNAIYDTSIICGYIARMARWVLAPLEAALTRIFTDPDVLEKNRASALLGWEYGATVSGLCALPQGESKPGRLLLDGSQAVALGVVVGGCSFISSYPMSPSTGYRPSPALARTVRSASASFIRMISLSLKISWQLIPTITVRSSNVGSILTNWLKLSVRWGDLYAQWLLIRYFRLKV